MELFAPGFGLVFWSLLIFVQLVALALAATDILKNEFRTANDRLIWILIILFVPFLGVALYYVIGRKSRIKIDQL
jgi:hypothetical protein